MEQERKFIIADFISTVGEDGSIQLPPQLLEVLGIDPGQAIHFEIDDKGEVTVKAYNSSQKNTDETISPSLINKEEVEQATLFGIEPSTPDTKRKHKSQRKET